MTLSPIELSPEDRNISHPENRPFICRPENRTRESVALLVHGFTGSPWEMIPLARHLAMNGVTSLAVRLPGHGTTPEDLANRSFEEWVEAVSNGQHFLMNEGQRQIAVGLSTGAMVVIAAHLSRQFDGLALLSPYLKVRHRLAPLAGLLRHFISYQKREIPDIERLHYYDKRPLEGIHQLNRLIKSIKEHLPAVSVPTLVACSDGDSTIDPESAIELYRLLGSRTKELHRFGAEVPHVLTTPENPKQQEVLELVSRFIDSINRQQGLINCGTTP